VPANVTITGGLSGQQVFDVPVPAGSYLVQGAYALNPGVAVYCDLAVLDPTQVSGRRVIVPAAQADAINIIDGNGRHVSIQAVITLSKDSTLELMCSNQDSAATVMFPTSFTALRLGALHVTTPTGTVVP
jgi:hypothetical protein